MNFKKEFWLLLSAFLLPIILGTGFFYLGSGFFTKNTINYGDFVKPIIKVQKFELEFNTPATLGGIWTLMLVNEKCDNSCSKTIKNMQDIRLLLNDNQRRLQLLLVNSTDKYKGLLSAKINPTLSQQLTKFPQNSLFLIDPIGNIMLHYDPQNLDIKRTLKDLNRLFKYSRIG